MTSQSDPYVRVYYRINEDPKFTGLDSAAVGTWVKLLIVADAMYPAAAPIPRWVEDAPLTCLVEAGLVDLAAGDTFRIHGMEAERSTRSAQATEAGKRRAAGAERAPDGKYVSSENPPNAGRSASVSQRQPTGSPPTGPAVSSSPSLSVPLHSVPSLSATEPAPSRGSTTGLTTNGERRTKPPPSEEEIAQHQAVLANPDAPEWLKREAREQLVVKGITVP